MNPALASPTFKTPPGFHAGFRSPQERHDILAWLNRGQRPGQGNRLEAEYPLLFDRNSNAIPCFLTERSSPVALCILWPTEMRLSGRVLRVGLISLVYTDPSFRGRGFAHRLLKETHREAERLDLGITLLWSDLSKLYTPLGYTEIGQENLLVITREISQKACRHSHVHYDSDSRLVEVGASPEDWNEIESFRRDRECGLQFEQDDFARLRTLPDMQIRLARKNDRVAAFALCGRGNDFSGVIHEWGGDTESILACIASLFQPLSPGSSLVLMAPDANANVPWKLRQAGARVVEQPICWMRMSSPKALLEDLGPLLPDIKQLEWALPKPNDSEAPARVRIETSSVTKIYSHAEWLHSLFGSLPTSKGKKQTEVSSFLKEHSRKFPLPFFNWGLESI